MTTSAEPMGKSPSTAEEGLYLIEVGYTNTGFSFSKFVSRDSHRCICSLLWTHLLRFDLALDIGNITVFAVE